LTATVEVGAQLDVETYHSGVWLVKHLSGTRQAGWSV